MNKIDYLILKHRKCGGDGCLECERKGYSIYTDLAIIDPKIVRDWVVLESVESGMTHSTWVSYPQDVNGWYLFDIPPEIAPKLPNGDVYSVFLVNRDDGRFRGIIGQWGNNGIVMMIRKDPGIIDLPNIAFTIIVIHRYIRSQ